MSNQHGPRFAKETLQGRLTSQASCSQLHFYQMKCYTQRRQTTLAIVAIKTIELISQPNWFADISVLVHPSREVRYHCSKPKGNTCIQVVFTQSPVSLTTTPEYLPVSGFNVPSLHLSQVSQMQQSKERKSYLTCLRHCITVQIPVKEKHESKLATKFPVSFQNTIQNSFHYLLSSGRFQ